MIIFDFDGVLIDSGREVALSAYNTVTSSRLSSFDDLPKGFSELYNKNRHLTVTPGKIVSFAKWVLRTIESGGSPDTPLTEQEFMEKYFEEDNLRGGEFFAVRQWLMDNHQESWLSLNKPYELVWSAAQKLDQNDYFILTYKNRAAVQAICKHYGLNFLEQRLFTGESGNTKRKNMLELYKIGGSHAKYVFVDDAIENLKALCDVLPGRLHPVLATWGYGNEDDQLSARKHGFELCLEHEFVTKYLQNNYSQRI